MYWPYLPLVLLVIAGLWLGHPTVERSQRGTVDFATNISAQELLDRTNQQRIANGDKPLIADQQLSAAANAKATDMVNRDYWQNLNTNDNNPLNFATRAGYQARSISENLAYGFDSSQQAIKGWLNSPSRRANLLNPAYKQVGFGVVKSGNFVKTGPETVIVAFFAEPTDGSIDAATSGAAIANTLGNNGTVTISRIQTMTGGRAPWIGLALASCAIAGLIFLFLKNGWHLRKSRKNKQKFALKHPVFDLTIIAFAALVALLCQGVGYIR